MHWKHLLPKDVFCSISVKVDDVVTIWNKKNFYIKPLDVFIRVDLVLLVSVLCCYVVDTFKKKFFFIQFTVPPVTHTQSKHLYTGPIHTADLFKTLAHFIPIHRAAFILLDE